MGEKRKDPVKGEKERKVENKGTIKIKEGIINNKGKVNKYNKR